MATECYALVRGSSVRVTALDKCGALVGGADGFPYAVSEAVSRVVINEVTEPGANEMLRNEEGERRLHLVRPTQTIRYRADINFLRVDPGLLSLVAGVPVVTNAAGDIVGFDSMTKLPAASFAMEVWSKLAGAACEGDRKYGYTLFPFLKGGLLSGFTFANGLVSFNLVGAQTRQGGSWGIGPYYMDGWCKLVTPVSGNTPWRQTLVVAEPPAATNGIDYYLDVIDGGTPFETSPDILDGGTPFEAGPCIVDGGTP